MTLPGYVVRGRKLRPTAFIPTETDPWFIAGPTLQGSAGDAQDPSNSLSDWVRRFGERTPESSIMYDSVEDFFNEGGSRIYTSRVYADNAVIAGHTFLDSAAANTLRIEFKKGPGVEGNNYNAAILADADGFKIQITKDGVTAPVETSPVLADKEAAFVWAEDAEYTTLIDQASALPPAPIAAQGLTGGSDGAAIDNDDYQTAVDRFTADLGPGQVSFPGKTTTASHAILTAHCALMGGKRFALLDFPDTDDEASLATQAISERDANSRYAFNLSGPWPKLPGIGAGVAARVVPSSASAAALMARSDGLGNSANAPAAGPENGVLRAAIGLSQDRWTDAQRETLNDAGLNPFVQMFGEFMLYGYRTGVDPNGDDAEWTQASNSRYYMSFAARVAKIASRFVFRQLDGRRRVVNEFGGLVVDLAASDWRDGALFGDTPEEAFYIDVSEAVNPNSELRLGHLNLVAGLTMSPFAEQVLVELVKLPIRVEA